MATYSDVVFIDESGNGSSTNDFLRNWVSVAIALAFDQMDTLDKGIHRILESHFSRYVGELKGSAMPRYLKTTSTVADVTGELIELLETTEAKGWGVASSYGRTPPPGFPASNPRAKDIVRHLLLERVDSELVARPCHPSRCMIIWDLSYHQELQEFNRSIAALKSAHDGTRRSERLVPAALGGISHDWSGLQAADVIAHCALHYLGHQASLPGSNRDKAKAFEMQLMPRLLEGSKGNLNGWAVW